MNECMARRLVTLTGLGPGYYAVLQRDDPRKLLAEKSMDHPRKKSEPVSHDASLGGAAVAGNKQGNSVHQDISEPFEQPTSASIGSCYILAAMLASWLRAGSDPASNRLRIRDTLAWPWDSRRRTEDSVRAARTAQ